MNKYTNSQRQAGRRLCKNILNSKNRNCGFIIRKKETAYYESDMRMYVSNAFGQFPMDHHTDISNLEKLKEQLSKEPTRDSRAKTEVRTTTSVPTTPTKKKTYWWAGAIVVGGILGIVLSTRKRSA